MGRYIYAVNEEAGIACEAYKVGDNEGDKLNDLPNRIEETGSLVRFLSYCWENQLTISLVDEEHDAVKRGVHPDELPDNLPKTLRVWTQFYLPFRMGGNTRLYRGAEYPVEYVGDIYGVKLFKAIIKPITGELIQQQDVTIDQLTIAAVPLFNGESLQAIPVIVTEDGAIVGNDLNMVRDDLEQTPPPMIAKQMEEAKKIVPRVEHIGQEEFSRMYLKNHKTKE